MGKEATFARVGWLIFCVYNCWDMGIRASDTVDVSLHYVPIMAIDSIICGSRVG